MIATLSVPDLTTVENDLLEQMLAQLQEKSVINARRSNYVDAKQVTRHLGIAIPPQLESVETVIGWPEKAVTGLEQRIDLDGFVVPGGTAADFGLDSVWAANRLAVEATEAHTSALKYGVAFLAVMDEGYAQPVIRTLSPTNSTVLWDRNRRRAAAGLTVVKHDTVGMSQFILFLDYEVITCTRNGSVWMVERSPHRLGRCPVAVLPHRPSTEAPLGRSRVTQGVMSITDRAVRSLLRMEVSAEFYSTPQRAVLGADESMFRDAEGNTVPKWTASVSRYLAVPLMEGEDGTEHQPDVKQFTQMTMQPHMDMVRSDAALFSGETSIPVNSLGVVHDNPASDAAMHTAFLDLDKSAERAHDSFGFGWVDAMQMAVQTRDGALPESLLRMAARFRDPSTPTKSMMSDAVMKQISTGVLDVTSPVEHEIALEQLGYDRMTIDRILGGRRRVQGRASLNMLVNGAGTPSPAEGAGTPSPQEEAAAMKTRFDALGVAIRSGVDPGNAASMLGLDGVQFTGAIPVSLRPLDRDASGLEDA